ncbi:MAG TPA: ADOP family duplicated permease [Gemmatimonadaceae bacterium]|nr:ADOP family duplicated permease [Gemmatimonadaceae bacterium]
MDKLLKNVHTGFRGLRRTPGFAAAAILTLALGIGLSTAVFTIANALLLRRLPVHDQDRIVLLWGETRDGRFRNFPLDLDDARAFIRESRSLERGAFYGYEGAHAVAARDGDRTINLEQTVTGGDFFAVLGAHPALGRTLAATDDQFGAEPVAVLSYSAWQGQYGGDPRVLGRRFTVHETARTYTIVGVMAEGFDYPRGTDFWVSVFPQYPPDALALRSFDLIGRLAPGATPQAARADLTAHFSRSSEEFLRNVRGVVHTLPEVAIGETRPALIAFGAAAGLLLLLACANVANLLLVRGIGRAREVAVRSALGASRAQLIAQLLTENGLLAVAGGLVGAAVCSSAIRVFVAFVPAGFPRASEIRVDGAALLAAFAITLAATLLFAVVPAVVTSRGDLLQTLGSGVRHSGGRRSRLVTELLAAGQLAIALVVLAAAAVITRSLVALERVNLGLEAPRLLVAQLAFDPYRYDDAKKQARVLETLMDRLGAMPGIEGVSTSVSVPFTQGWEGRPTAEGQTSEEIASDPVLAMDVVDVHHFTTLGVSMLRGRAFSAADGPSQPKVVILSESAAQYYWPGQNPIGKRMLGAGDTATVVGVAPDSRYRDLREPRRAIYYPLAQSVFPFAPTNLIVRATGSPAALVPAVRRALDEVAPGVILANGSTFESYLDAPLAQPRLNALLLAVFAAAATTLAAIGLFGVMATMVRQRTRELGVRMALGATARDIRDLVVGRGLTIALAGAAAGLAGALAANRLLAAMLFEVSPADAVSLAAVAIFLLVVALIATLLPARSSTRIDPVVALRVDG